MALIDQVKARFSTARLAQLTRPDGQGSTVDDVFLQAAIDDVVASLDGFGVGSWDDAEPDAALLLLISDGVEALLRKRIGVGDTAQSRWDAWLEQAKEVGLTRRRDRIKPITVQAARRFPRRVFRSTTPGQPDGGSSFGQLLRGDD